MNIDSALIQRVARNARITLTPDEAKRFEKEFAEIVEAFSTIANAPVADAPSVQPEPVLNVLRDDKPTLCLTQEQALENAVHKKDGYFKGPRAV